MVCRRSRGGLAATRTVARVAARMVLRAVTQKRRRWGRRSAKAKRLELAKTKEMVKKAMGGILLVDEANYLYNAANDRDYGQESIEILLNVMENNKEVRH